MPEWMSNTPNIDELRRHAQALCSLLETPHPGLFTWRQSLHIKLARLRNILDQYPDYRSKSDETKSP